MLIKTADILTSFNPVEEDFSVQEYSTGYLKYGLYSRSAYFFHAFYKAYNLEAFKANVHNAATLAEIMSKLLNWFIPNIPSWTVITTPKRSHTDKLGYHFASEVLKLVSLNTGIQFLEDVLQAKDKNKIAPVFHQVKDVPSEKLILFDDILTTGKTIYTSLEVLRESIKINPIIIIGINNN